MALARRAMLLPPSLSRILQFLERERIIERRQDPRDQRRSLFRLTAKGRSLFEQVAPQSEALYRQIEVEFEAFCDKFVMNWIYLKPQEGISKNGLP